MKNRRGKKKSSSKTDGTGHQIVPHRRTVVRGPYLPPEFDVTIPISWVWTSGASTTFLTQAYKINSLADSNINYVGLANFNNFYTKYRVTGFALHFDFCGNALSSVHTCYSASLSPVSTAISSAAEVLTNAVMPRSIGATCGTSTGYSIERRKLSASTAAIAGTDEVLTSDTYSAATSPVADPSDLIYLHLGYRQLNGASTTLAAAVVVRGHLSVRYFERKTTA